MPVQVIVAGPCSARYSKVIVTSFNFVFYAWSPHLQEFQPKPVSSVDVCVPARHPVLHQPILGSQLDSAPRIFAMVVQCSHFRRLGGRDRCQVSWAAKGGRGS